jgi:hypothetical protein
MNKGTVFQPLGEGYHPWFVISDKDGEDYVLAVNISDHAKHPDANCILLKGEHPAVTKDSSVMFRFAQAFKATPATEKELAKYATMFPDCPTELLDRMIAVALDHESGLPQKFRRFLPNLAT